MTNARGQTTSLLQHTAATPTGTGDTTTYVYTKRGELAAEEKAGRLIYETGKS